MAKKLQVDSINDLETLKDLEDSPRGGKRPMRGELASLPKASAVVTGLEGVEVLPDGRIRLTLSQGIDCILDPRHKVFEGQGMSIRFGTLPLQLRLVAGELQVLASGIQINIKSLQPQS